MMTRATPFPSQPSMVRMSRMPPPSWTGIRVRAARTFSTACGVHRLAGEGPVEIDDMQIFKALALESQGLRGRIVVENGGQRHVAMDQTDALPALEIDCRKQNHGRHLKKLEISRKPKVWLFSG